MVDAPAAQSSSSQNATQLPGVVVTGNSVSGTLSSPKFTEPVLDTPQTIAVIPPEVYEAQAAATLTDVLRNTPGITLFAGEGGSASKTGGDSFYLRGFDTSNSIFIDGVRDEGAVVRDVFDLEQVEVVKGPSAENGRGGTAGYINLETKMPEVRSFQDLLTSYTFGQDGSGGSERAALDVNQPLPQSPIAGTAFRLNLMDQDGGVPGRHYARNDRWAVAPSLAFGLGSPTEVYLSYLHQYEHNLPDYGLPSTALPGFAPAVPAGSPSYTSPGVNPSTYYGFPDIDYEHVANDAAEARIVRDFGGGLRLENQTRYDETARKVEASSASGSVTVAPPGEAAIAQGIYQTKNEILSNQTNLTDLFDTGPVDHALTSGLELSRETADNPIWSVVPAGAPNPNTLVNIYQPLDFPTALPNYDPHETGSATDTRINTAAAYAFDTASLGRFWELTAGLRLEHYDVNERSITVASPAIPALAPAPGTATVPGTAAVAAVAAVPASDADLEADDTAASWKTGLVFKPVPDGSLYASVDTAIVPPGTSSAANTLSTTATSADNPLLEPERAINYETGIKWNFLHERLLADLAVFRSVDSNVPSTDPVSGLVNQTSDQTVQGVELDVSGKITAAWLVYGGYSQMEAKVSSEISTNAQGLTLPLLPKESGNLWTTYKLPDGFTVGAGTQYMGETQRLQATGAPTTTTFANQVPSFWLFNAMVSWNVNRRMTLRFNVNNIANRAYVASLNNNGYRLNLGTPRDFVLSADFKF